MKLKLVKLTPEYKPQLDEMMTEWTAAGEQIIPAAISRNDFRDFDTYLSGLGIKEPKDGHVPATTLFCLDEERNIFVGAVDIRHYLNEALLKTGGHIGDGVRPSERRKGIATKMIRLALDECKKLGIDRVLMTCDDTNTGSAKSIENNGGKLENKVEDGDKLVRRYWIKLN